MTFNVDQLSILWMAVQTAEDFETKQACQQALQYYALAMTPEILTHIAKLEAALPPQDGLAELRALLDEHDKAHGETKYTPSKQPVYAMTMDYLHRQTFAAMYAYVRTELERTKG